MGKNLGGDYGMRKGRKETREDGEGYGIKEARKERREKGEISVHRQAMADALEVIHLQEKGTWNR